MFKNIMRVMYTLYLTASISEGSLIFVDNSALEVESKWDRIDGHVYSIGKTDGKGFLTIKAATSIAEAGDTIYIRKGTYNEHSISLKNTGTSSKPILISNYLSEKVIIDGLMEIGNDSAIFRIDKVSYIKINGLNITGFGNDFWGGSFFLGQNHKCSNITITNCEIYTDGLDANNDNPAQLNMYSSDSCSIIGCKIYLLNAQKGVGPGVCGIKIWVANTHVLIDGCEMYGFQSPAIFNKHGVPDQNLIIRNNYTHDNISFIGDIHINAANSIVENNLIVSSRTGIMVFHAAGDHGGNGTIIRHNTIYGCITGIILNDSNEPQLFDVVVKDNIIMGGSGEFRDFSIAPYCEPYTHNHISDYNCYFNVARNEVIREFGDPYSLGNWISVKKQDVHSIQKDPLFVNADNRDFRLSASSPCKLKASDGRDMGAIFDNIVGIKNTTNDKKKGRLPTAEQYVKISPNPCSQQYGKVTISTIAEIADFHVYSVNGSLLYSSDYKKSKSLSWNLKKSNGKILPAGTYILILHRIDRAIIKDRILITK